MTENSRQEHEFLQRPRIYRFGEFVLNVALYELRKDGTPIRLQPKTFAVLCYLVSHPGRLIDKDELLGAVWPDVIVTENSLTRCVKDLRKALDDDAANPRYIETIARRGYRLLVTPEPIDDAVPVTDNQSGTRQFAEVEPVLTAPPTAAPRRRRNLIAFGAIAAFAVIVAIAAAISGIGWRGPGPETGTARPTIAVLPFTNLSTEPDTQYFAEGVAEDLLDLFAQMPNLRVVARTSSSSFRGQERDVKAIARELQVDWVLEGSVRRETGNVRVSVQLIDARTGIQAWSGRYDRKYVELFAMQDEITRAVVAQVAPRVEWGTLVASAAPTANFDAYQSFMIGRDYLNRRVFGWPARSLAAFDRAIELDPAFARAYAGKAIAELAVAESTANPRPGFARARSSADHALKLDPVLAFGHAARGFILLNDGSDPREAEGALRRALQLDPSQGNTYNWLASVLRRQGRRGEALQQWEKGIAVDPLNPAMILNRANQLFWLGRFDEARADYTRALQLPEFHMGKYLGLAQLHTSRGELAEGLRYMRLMARKAQLADATLKFKVDFGAYARLGMFDEAGMAFTAASGTQFKQFRLLDFESYLRILGRFNELEPLARRFIAAEPAPPLLGKYLGRAAALRGDWDLAIARLAPIFRAEPPDALGGWGTDPLELDSHLALVHSLMKKNRMAEAQTEVARVLGWHRAAQAAGYAGTSEELYLYAMTLALSNPARDDEAFAALEQAVLRGWNNYHLAQQDPRWERLKPDPRFKSTMEKAAQSVGRERAIVAARIAAGDPDFVDTKH